MSKTTYGDREIERGLIAIASSNGNARKASRDLAEDGLEIPHSTLASWKDRVHTARYQEVRAEILPKIREQTGDEHLALARMQISASAKATEAFMEKLDADELDARDLSTAARNFDVGSGIHTQNSSLLHGEPTERVARDSASILRELKSIGFDAIDVEVVSEEDIPAEPVSS